MSTTFQTDDRLAGFAPAKASGPFAWGRFNAALLTWQFATGLATFLTSDRARHAPWAGLFLSTTLDFTSRMVVLGVTAGFLAVFWGRFVATVAATRPISYGEALAAVLMIGLLFGR